jgi:hypothetical protein
MITTPRRWEDLAYDAKSVTPSEARWNQGPHAVVEENRTDPVAAGCGKGEEARDLADEVVYRHHARTETGRRRQIDQKEHVEVALLTVALDVENARARRDVPVDSPHIVTRAVLTHLLELQPEAAECTLVQAGKAGLHRLAGTDLEPTHLGSEFRPDVPGRRLRTRPPEVGGETRGHSSAPRRRGAETFERFNVQRLNVCLWDRDRRWLRHGTSTASRMRSVISSTVAPSASAS